MAKCRKGTYKNESVVWGCGKANETLFLKLDDSPAVHIPKGVTDLVFTVAGGEVLLELVDASLGSVIAGEDIGLITKENPVDVYQGMEVVCGFRMPDKKTCQITGSTTVPMRLDLIKQTTMVFWPLLMYTYSKIDDCPWETGQQPIPGCGVYDEEEARQDVSEWSQWAQCKYASNASAGVEDAAWANQTEIFHWQLPKPDGSNVVPWFMWEGLWEQWAAAKEDRAYQAMHFLDTNHDDVISKEEFVEGYFLAPDTCSPGAAPSSPLGGLGAWRPGFPELGAWWWTNWMVWAAAALALWCCLALCSYCLCCSSGGRRGAKSKAGGHGADEEGLHPNGPVVREPLLSREKEAPVVMSMAVQGVDYAGLVASPDLRAGFEGSVRKAIIGDSGLPEENVELELSSGSVLVKALVRPPPGGSAQLLAGLRASEQEVGKRAAAGVGNLPGIGAVATGPIGVDVLGVQAGAHPQGHSPGQPESQRPATSGPHAPTLDRLLGNPLVRQKIEDHTPSLHFHQSRLLGYQEHLTDGFRAVFSQELLLVDARRDAALYGFMDFLHHSFPHSEGQGSVVHISAVAKAISHGFGGGLNHEHTPGEDVEGRWQQRFHQLRLEFPQDLPIGLLLGRHDPAANLHVHGAGLQRHRAVLFKYVCDSLRICSSALLWDAKRDTAINLAWTGGAGGRPMVVDCSSEPGQLREDYQLHHLVQQLEGERQASSPAHHGHAGAPPHSAPQLHSAQTGSPHGSFSPHDGAMPHTTHGFYR